MGPDGGIRRPQENHTLIRRKIALVLVGVLAALTLEAGPALAARANGVCGGVVSEGEE